MGKMKNKQLSAIAIKNLPQCLTLEENNLHAWYGNSQDFKPYFQEYFSILSPQEQASCLRFKFKDHQLYYAIAHAILRLILSRYLNCHTSEIAFYYTEKGRPEIADPKKADFLSFNLSHSQAGFMIGVRRMQTVGVDLEDYNRNISDALAIAQHSFHPKEIAELLSVPVADRLKIFFKIWTQKEAYLKACGFGLSAGLNQFQVSTLENSRIVEPHLLEAANTDGSKIKWFCQHCELAQKFISCICTPQPVNDVNYYHLLGPFSCKIVRAL